MNIKNRKETRTIQTEVIMSMPIRETLFGAAALLIGGAVGIYLLTKGFSTAVICPVMVLIGAPICAFGFYKKHNMRAETVIAALIRSRFFLSGTLYFKPQNQFKSIILNHKKEERKNRHADKRKDNEEKTQR